MEVAPAPLILPGPREEAIGMDDDFCLERGISLPSW